MKTLSFLRSFLCFFSPFFFFFLFFLFFLRIQSCKQLQEMCKIHIHFSNHTNYYYNLQITRRLFLCQMNILAQIIIKGKTLQSSKNTQSNVCEYNHLCLLPILTTQTKVSPNMQIYTTKYRQKLHQNDKSQTQTTRIQIYNYIKWQPLSNSSQNRYDSIKNQPLKIQSITTIHHPVQLPNHLVYHKLDF
eukprot:TRINITY_DN23007_c3_g1_i1.p1 TRINITY_DN23007_c3_g1~~TRINITY_DN23007_c3_g1_i1.p1  ORF type:complete len:200 (-),score=-19.90 TRINITY_DN23007_c3_g1_i1:25-591(-)